jgi:NAD(P)-dependent dehydrogenase (short-subunit alcohol dehydrogenase family)
VDVCVSNAAVTDTIAPVHRMTAEQWSREIDVNLTGAFRVVQDLPARDARAPARTDRGGVEPAAAGGLPGQVDYAASKAGLLGMVRTNRHRRRGEPEHDVAGRGARLNRTPGTVPAPPSGPPPPPRLTQAVSRG